MLDMPWGKEVPLYTLHFNLLDFNKVDAGESKNLFKANTTFIFIIFLYYFFNFN